MGPASKYSSHLNNWFAINYRKHQTQNRGFKSRAGINAVKSDQFNLWHRKYLSKHSKLKVKTFHLKLKRIELIAKLRLEKKKRSDIEKQLQWIFMQANQRLHQEKKADLDEKLTLICTQISETKDDVAQCVTELKIARKGLDNIAATMKDIEEVEKIVIQEILLEQTNDVVVQCVTELQIASKVLDKIAATIKQSTDDD